MPITMYGCNKLYCEHVGRYFTLPRAPARARSAGGARIDFRSIRFPGLISADYAPTGGTSDFGPGMIHAAASNTPYSCFVRPDARIPFMATPDAVRALHRSGQRRSRAPHDVRLQHRRLQPERRADRRSRARSRSPRRASTTSPIPCARRSSPRGPRTWTTRGPHGLGLGAGYPWDRAFDEYLVPNITARYGR